MKRQIVILMSITGLMALFCFKARHDFHTSLTEMRYSTRSHSLETSIRVFTDDLENALSKANKRAVKMNDADAGKLVKPYILKNFAFVKADKVVLAEYIGLESEPDVTWIYVEFKDPGNLSGLDLLNTIFLELFDDQSNLVNIIYPNDRKTLLFNQKKKLLPYPF